MSDDEPVTIRKYGSPQDAHLAKSVLTGDGIRACVADDVVTAWLWHVGTALGGAKLQVARRDAVRATEILRTIESHSTATDGATWMCPQCGADVDGGFDACWSCETARGEVGSTAAIPGHSPDSVRRADSDEEDAEEVAMPPAEADARRAWRAAIFGLLFPPLSLYSLYLLVKNMNRELSPPATRRFYAALAISLVTLSIWWTILFRL